MCTISLNVRGIGQESKIKWLKRICNKEKPTILGLQETKCGQTQDNVIESFWGNSVFKFIQKDSIGASGGIMIIWDTNSFNFDIAIAGEFFLAIKGTWAGYNSDIAIINVYGPHSNPNKLKMWNELSSLTNSLDIPFFIFGDFNEVRNKNERMNCDFNQVWADIFNNFINNNGLLDIPLGGKNYTRICKKRMQFSKIDRFLVSEELKDIDNVTKTAWKIPVNGNHPDCIFRNKLKNVKMELKRYSFQLDNIDSQIANHLRAASKWEETANNRTPNETKQRKWIEEKMLHNEKEKMKSKMLKQKSRIKWALEGDENSKYFHNYIKRRINKNNICGVTKNGIGPKIQTQ
ncbi:uncharacterized protein [Rutidosis leptorrhynchoides]|uniref:uncharacterized protein n=1 Tax=Rutidosis leptorrhynchoides TaxID=125765 RepID=UPI003A99B0FE